jgi:tRNA (Thr-GGU) A37 N-methylase
MSLLNAAPLLDLKPYFASTDSAPDASVGWHASRKR